MGKQNEKCSASKLYTLGNLYIRYILHASMHCVSRELAQHKIMYELFYWLLKWTSLESFFLSRFLFIFSFSCFAKCLSLMQINVEAILLTISTECSWNKFITSGYLFKTIFCVLTRIKSLMYFLVVQPSFNSCFRTFSLVFTIF